MRDIRKLSLAAFLVWFSVAANGQDELPDEDTAGPLDQTVPVAEEETVPAVEEETAPDDGADLPEEITEETVLAEFARFRQLLLDRNYDEADVSAKRVVEMAIKVFGPNSHETAKALNNLAIVQQNNEQYSAAVQNFTSAVEILEIVEDRLNEQLVNPLKGLGSAQLSSGRPDLAFDAFNRATHITHVNEGPHNIEQVEILESLAEASVRLGDLEEARDTLDRIHVLNVRHFADDALGLLPSLMRRADWQHRAGYYNDERVTYRRAIRVIETAVGKKDPRLVEPLVLLGKSFYYYEPAAEGSRLAPITSGEVYFKRAVRLAEASEDFPWLELAATKLALADYYLAFDTHNRARKIYLEVWNSLSVDEDHIEMRKDLLERPIAIRVEPLPRYTTGGSRVEPAAGLRTGVIQVDYTISPRGRVRNIRTEANPTEFTDMQKMVHREIRTRVFRPTLVDGVPVESESQIFRHEFRYTEAEFKDLQRKKAEAEEKSEGSR